MRIGFAILIILAAACDEHAVPDAPSGAPSTEASGGAESGSGPTLSSSTPSTPAEGRRVHLSNNVWDGVCLAHSWQNGGRAGYGTDESAETLDHLESIGVGWISITPFSWMQSQQAPSIRGEHNSAIPEAAESEARVRGVVDQARSREIQIVLKPHIWIRGGAYRGDIEPRDEDGELAWDAWWDSYDAYILYYAEQAAQLDIPVFFVGVELESAIDANPSRFSKTIAKVRGVYDGELIYAANWDEDVPDRIWRTLDYIGVQFYPPISESDSPTTEQLVEGVRRGLSRWRETAKRTGKKLVIAEVGFRAAPDAAKTPHSWPEDADGDGRTPDKDLQRRAYVALFSVLADVRELQGVFVWKYFTDADTDERQSWGFSPRGYPAEDVLRRAYGPDEVGKPAAEQ
jgi:hypothetical protein